MADNMLSVGHTTQNGDNYLKDSHLMPPERLRINMPPSLVVLSLTLLPQLNNTDACLITPVHTLMHTCAPVHTGLRVAAVRWSSAGWFLEAQGHLAVASSLGFASIT